MLLGTGASGTSSRGSEENGGQQGAAVPGGEGALCRPKGRQADREPGLEILPLAPMGGETGGDG